MKIILFANTDWYLHNYRMPLAETLVDLQNELILLSPAGDYSNQISSLGFNWREVKITRSGINPLREIRTIFHLAKIYRHEKPDLVHHFTSKCVLYGSVAAKLAGITRVINSVTGMGFVFTKKTPLTFFLKPFVLLFYRLSLTYSHVIFQNQQDLDFFVGHHLVKASNCALIPSSGVDLEKFHPTLYQKGDPLVILPARMLWDKGVGEFFEAAKMLKNKGIKARFALVGGPDPDNPSSISEEQLEQWSHSGIIEYWGWQTDMASVYQKSSVVCLPSYREGLAKGLIEAASCGRALVASDIPGCREVVMQGVNGFLVPIRKIIPLAEAIEKIILDKQLMAKMGKESRKIAEREFSVEKINRGTIFEYNKLITGENAKKLVY